MKAFKKLTVLFLIIFVLATNVFAFTLEAGTGEEFYCNDYANALSSNTKSTIAEYNSWLESNCSDAQFVVVTVNYLDEGTDTISAQLMTEWGVGSKEESNGMLLLYVVQEGRGWLSVGDGIDNVFTDDMSSDYLNNYFWDLADKGAHDQAVLSLAEQIVNWYSEYYGVSYTGSASTSMQGSGELGNINTPPYEANQEESPFSGLISLIIFILIIRLIISISRNSRMNGWGYTGGWWPIFWFGGRRLYRDWHGRYAPHYNPGPGSRGPMGSPGPRGPMGGSRPHNVRPGNSGGGYRPSSSHSSFGGSSHSSFGGSSHSSSFHGGGFGGHSGGGGGGRR